MSKKKFKGPFDLKDPRIRKIIEVAREHFLKAWNADRRVEQAVLPIHFQMKAEGKASQVASCVALEIENECFLLSASHVFDDIKDHRLLISAGNGELLHSLGGERVSTLRGVSGAHQDDPLDASVFHVQSAVPESLRKVALTLADIDLQPFEPERWVCAAAGFRCSQSSLIGNTANSRNELFPSIEYDEDIYALLKLDPKMHLALAYENQIIINGEWQTSPTPRGFSGGAIIKFKGIPILPDHSDAKIKPMLAAITIEQRREGRNIPGALIGTRIRVHLSLIHKHFPELNLPEVLERFASA